MPKTGANDMIVTASAGTFPIEPGFFALIGTSSVSFSPTCNVTVEVVTNSGKMPSVAVDIWDFKIIPAGITMLTVAGTLRLNLTKPVAVVATCRSNPKRDMKLVRLEPNLLSTLRASWSPTRSTELSAMAFDRSEEHTSELQSLRH